MVVTNKGAVRLLDPSSDYWREHCKAQPGIWVQEKSRSVIYKTIMGLFYATATCTGMTITNSDHQPHSQAGQPSRCT